jgi:hypothetical protein
MADLKLANNHFNNGALVGKATYSFLFWDIYHAQLVAPGGIYKPGNPIALTLTYGRDFAGQDIVDKSIEEIRINSLQDEEVIVRWRTELFKVIPNVKAGDSISGIRNTKGHSIFYFNESPLGVIKDEDFSREFFDIWIGKNTSDQEFTLELLGISENN